MGWRLKSGLSKTAVYQIIVDHNTGAVELPSIRKCSFTKCRASYWFDYFDCGYRYHLYFTTWGGQALLRFERLDYDEIEDCYNQEILFCRNVSFDYLLEHELLREVA